MKTSWNLIKLMNSIKWEMVFLVILIVIGYVNSQACTQSIISNSNVTECSGLKCTIRQHSVVEMSLSGRGTVCLNWVDKKIEFSLKEAVTYVSMRKLYHAPLLTISKNAAWCNCPELFSQPREIGVIANCKTSICGEIEKVKYTFAGGIGRCLLSGNARAKISYDISTSPGYDVYEMSKPSTHLMFSSQSTVNGTVVDIYKNEINEDAGHVSWMRENVKFRTSSKEFNDIKDLSNKVLIIDVVNPSKVLLLDRSQINEIGQYDPEKFGVVQQTNVMNFDINVMNRLMDIGIGDCATQRIHMKSSLKKFEVARDIASEIGFRSMIKSENIPGLDASQENSHIIQSSSEMGRTNPNDYSTTSLVNPNSGFLQHLQLGKVSPDCKFVTYNPGKTISGELDVMFCNDNPVLPNRAEYYHRQIMLGKGPGSSCLLFIHVPNVIYNPVLVTTSFNVSMGTFKCERSLTFTKEGDSWTVSANGKSVASTESHLEIYHTSERVALIDVSSNTTITLNKSSPEGFDIVTCFQEVKNNSVSVIVDSKGENSVTISSLLPGYIQAQVFELHGGKNSLNTALLKSFGDKLDLLRICSRGECKECKHESKDVETFEKLRIVKIGGTYRDSIMNSLNKIVMPSSYNNIIEYILGIILFLVISSLVISLIVFSIKMIFDYVPLFVVIKKAFLFLDARMLMIFTKKSGGVYEVKKQETGKRQFERYA